MLRPMLGALATALSILIMQPAFADVRIKDIATFEGVRENQLVGYGLVVGLKGTGDKASNSPFMANSMAGMLERLGAGGVPPSALKTKNTAAVMVTANLTPYARMGTRLDVLVSSIGDASSLMGGTLVITALAGSDGETYAVAQGPISVAGYSAQGENGSIVEGVPTVARMENGATVEREIPFDLNSMDSIQISLREQDFTTAGRMAAAINTELGKGRAKMLDPSTVEVRTYSDDVPMMLARIENLTLTPDTRAKVVIDAKSGTIVIGNKVRIDNVAVSQGGLTVKITETAEVTPPSPINIGGTAVVVPKTDIQVTEKDAQFVVLEGGDVSLQELVDGLNAIGVGAKETVSILQAIKAAGALHADLELI